MPISLSAASARCLRKFALLSVAASLLFAGAASAEVGASKALQVAPQARAAGNARIPMTVESSRGPGASEPNLTPSGPVASASYASTAVGTTAASYITFTSTFTAATTVYGSAVFTEGAPNLDFKDVGTGTCDTNGYPYSYAANASCTSIISFTPTKAGNRLGAELLYTAADDSTYFYGPVNGIGTGPQATYSLPTPTITSTLSVSAYNSVVDGSNNLWVSDSVNKVVDEFVPAGGVYPATPTNTFTGFTTPQGLAVDGQGDIYVGDGGAGNIWELAATNGTVTAGTAPLAYVNFLTPSTTQPSAVAFDPTYTYTWFTGVYNGSNYLIRCTISSGSCALGTTFTASKGLTIDSAGYKYVVDSSTKIVYRMPVGTSVTKTSLITTGLTLPYGITYDAAGDLYVTDAKAGTAGTGIVTEYVATAGLVPAADTNTRAIATGLFNPFGIVLNSAGNIFISDNGNAKVKLIDNTDPFTLTFPSTTYGSTSATQTATFQNIGNAALSFPVPASGTTNPALTAGYSLDATSTCPNLTSSSSAGTLAAGANCTEAVKFTPTAGGTTTGTDVTTDTSLNVTSTQTINLTGTSPAQSTQTVVSLSSTTGTVGGNTVFYTATVTDTQNTSLVPTGTVIFSDTVNGNTGTYGPFTINGSGTYQIGTQPEMAGTHTISVAFTPTDATQFATSVAAGQTLTVAQGTLNPNAPAYSVQQGVSAVLTVFFGYPGSIPPSGAVSFQINDGSSTSLSAPACVYKTLHSNCQATYTPSATLTPGTYTLSFSQAGDSNYVGNSGSTTVTVTGPASLIATPKRTAARTASSIR